MELQRFCLKLFTEGPGGVDPVDLIPVFHRFIQMKELAGTLIDVADYSHVQEGPGVMLVAHEATYTLDDRRGRRGLSYWRKQVLPGDLAERIEAGCRDLLKACRAIELAPELAGGVRFRGRELQFAANDRLIAANTPDVEAALWGPLSRLLHKLYRTEQWELTRQSDSRELLTLTVSTDAEVDVATLLGRLS